MPIGPDEIGKLLPLLGLNDKDKAVALEIIDIIDDNLSYVVHVTPIGIPVPLNKRKKGKLTEKTKAVLGTVYRWVGWKQVEFDSQGQRVTLFK